MYLKSLTVLGFKSFADKTTLNFLPGVSCIVGPNGCGKSNVSDAIRWVLGEQSAKALRGGELADVIFNGTDGRKPMGMAEVALTIGDVDQNLLRVQDLIREVKRQIGSLQRQAGKARRYKQIMQELRHLDTQLARHQFDLLQTEISTRQTAADKLRVEIETGSESVLRGED